MNKSISRASSALAILRRKSHEKNSWPLSIPRPGTRMSASVPQTARELPLYDIYLYAWYIYMKYCKRCWARETCMQSHMYSLKSRRGMSGVGATRRTFYNTYYVLSWIHDSLLIFLFPIQIYDVFAAVASNRRKTRRSRTSLRETAQLLPLSLSAFLISMAIRASFARSRPIALTFLPFPLVEYADNYYQRTPYQLPMTLKL